MRDDVRERRASPRVPIPVPVRYRVSGSEHELRSEIADLSAGGLSFASDEPLDPGTLLEVTFPLETARFVLEATVVQVTAEREDVFLIGVRFLAPDERFRARLAEQVLRINERRRELSLVRNEEVTTEEAARHWIERYAREFADLCGDD